MCIRDSLEPGPWPLSNDHRQGNVLHSRPGKRSRYRARAVDDHRQRVLRADGVAAPAAELHAQAGRGPQRDRLAACLLYTSDAADERSRVDLGCRRLIKKKKQNN